MPYYIVSSDFNRVYQADDEHLAKRAAEYDMRQSGTQNLWVQPITREQAETMSDGRVGRKALHTYEVQATWSDQIELECGLKWEDVEAAVLAHVQGRLLGSGLKGELEVIDVSEPEECRE